MGHDDVGVVGQMRGSDTVHVAPLKPLSVTGVGATLLFVRLRWRMIRPYGLKVGAVILFLGVLLALYSTMNMGYLVQIAAQQGTDTAQTIYATTWTSSLDSGYIASVGALAVGGAVLIALFAPLTGTSTLAFIAEDDTLGLRPPRLRRFWDSFIINTTSGIGILQLFTLTTVASLITLDGVKVWALLFTWALWITLVALNTTLGFVFEYTQRKWGKTKKRIVGSALVGILGFALLFDENRGSDLFGLAPYYSKVLRLSVTNFNWVSVILILTCVFLTFALIKVGKHFTEKALSLPENNTTRGKLRKTKKFGSTPFAVSFIIVARTLMRTKEVRKPVYTIIFLGVPMVAFFSLDDTLVIALTMTIPLALSLGWGVNFFGVLGQGMYWLGSQPYIMKYLPKISFFLQFVLSFSILSVLLSVSLIKNANSNLFLNTAILFLISFVNSYGAASIANFISIGNPIRSPLKNKGDALVPPLTVLVYLIVVVGLGCLPGVLMAQQESLQAQLITAGISFTVSTIFLTVAWLWWRKPEKRANVVSVVAVE